MIELPQWLLRPERQRIEYARKLAATAGSDAVFSVEQLVAMLVQAWEHGHTQAAEHRAERDRLEKLVVRLGGGFDRRGLDTEPRGLMVQHGIHTVVEEAP